MVQEVQAEKNRHIAGDSNKKKYLNDSKNSLTFMYLFFLLPDVIDPTLNKMFKLI